MASSPRDSQQTDRHQPDTEVRESPSRSSSSLRVLRRQGAAKHKLARRQAAKLCYRFGSLDPFRPLREPDRRRRNEERLSRSEQRTGNKPKIQLDRKSPIQVRIHLPPAKSRANSASPDRPRGDLKSVAALKATTVAAPVDKRTAMPPVLNLTGRS